MARPPAPHAQRVMVRDAETGQTLEAWSVDARELVTMHPARFAYVVPETPPPAVPAPTEPASAPTVDFEERLDALGYLELQDLARRVGIASGQKKPALIAALLPHLEGGTLSLEKPTDLLGAPAPRVT